VRALILVLSLLVVGLSASILLAQPRGPDTSNVFVAARLIGDAAPGEQARYRDEEGYQLVWRVDGVIPGTADRPAQIRITRFLVDPRGRSMTDASGTYDHFPSRHGLFPLTAPSDPQGYDRLWVWTRIRRETVPWRGGTRKAWRVDLIDPALPSEGDRDHAIAWLDETIPVYGLLRFQHNGRTWEWVEGEAP
jgi:hypothetical protein